MYNKLSEGKTETENIADMKMAGESVLVDTINTNSSVAVHVQGDPCRLMRKGNRRLLLAVLGMVFLTYGIQQDNNNLGPACENGDNANCRVTGTINSDAPAPTPTRNGQHDR